MRNLNQGERIHQRSWELLPWYANGSLAEREREMVEAHLAACPLCQQEVSTCQRTQEAARNAAEVAPSPHPVQLQRILARIEESEREDAGRRAWWRGEPFRGVVEAAHGPLRRALVAQAAIILLLIGLLVWQRTSSQPAPTLYQTLSDPAPAPVATAAIRVMFSPRATEREIRDLLVGVRGQITAGPSPIGVYTLEVPNGEPMKAVLARLRSEPQVAFAEPVGGNETEREAR